MRVEKDFEELLGLFNKHKVRHCIIGAFAVGFYGYPRYTKDIDILVEPSLTNAQRIIAALDEFGFASMNLAAKDFSKEGTVVQLGYEPVRVDLMTSIKGLTFNQIWNNKTTGKYGNQKVFFMGLKELIRSKTAASRAQDRVDLKILQERLTKNHR